MAGARLFPLLALLCDSPPCLGVVVSARARCTYATGRRSPTTTTVASGGSPRGRPSCRVFPFPSCLGGGTEILRHRNREFASFLPPGV